LKCFNAISEIWITDATLTDIDDHASDQFGNGIVAIKQTHNERKA
jgi:hypothetical protein